MSAVVADEAEHLGTAGSVPGQTKRLGVGLRRRQGELPGRQPPAPRQLFGDDDRVLRGQHELGAGGDAPLHGAHDRRRVDAAEGALVADVGVEKAAPVGAGEVGAVALGHPDGRVREVADHPAHGHAVRHALAGALTQRQAARMLARVTRGLALPQLRDALCIDSGPFVHRSDDSSAPTARRRTRRRREAGGRRVQTARIRLFLASCSTSARPRASITGRHVVREAPAQALLEAVPAADRIVRGPAPGLHGVVGGRLLFVGAAQRHPVAAFFEHGLQIGEATQADSAAPSCRPRRRGPADRPPRRDTPGTRSCRAGSSGSRGPRASPRHRFLESP